MERYTSYTFKKENQSGCHYEVVIMPLGGGGKKVSNAFINLFLKDFKI